MRGLCSDTKPREAYALYSKRSYEQNLVMWILFHQIDDDEAEHMGGNKCKFWLEDLKWRDHLEDQPLHVKIILK